MDVEDVCQFLCQGGVVGGVGVEGVVYQFLWYIFVVEFCEVGVLVDEDDVFVDGDLVDGCGEFVDLFVFRCIVYVDCWWGLQYGDCVEFVDLCYEVVQ